MPSRWGELPEPLVPARHDEADLESNLSPADWDDLHARYADCQASATETCR